MNGLSEDSLQDLLLLCRQVPLFAGRVPRDQHLRYTFLKFPSKTLCFSQNSEPLTLEHKGKHVLGRIRPFYCYFSISPDIVCLNGGNSSAHLPALHFRASQLMLFQHIWIYDRMKCYLHFPAIVNKFKTKKELALLRPVSVNHASRNPSPKRQKCKAIFMYPCVQILLPLCALTSIYALLRSNHAWL
jgi:hypothetical protein